MITEDYVSYEVAKLLKEKGFDETCYACYEYFSSSVTMYSGWPFEYKGEVVNNSKDRIKCPTLQMAMKWLREVHKLPINIWYDKEEDTPDDEVWTSEIAIGIPYTIVGSFASYEEACEAGIKYCLKNLI